MFKLEKKFDAKNIRPSISYLFVHLEVGEQN